MTESDHAAQKQSSVLTERQIKALPYLVASCSFEDGRKAARISKNTLYEWLRQPAFRSELQRLRDLVVNEALDRLKSRVAQAVEVLARLLESRSEAVRLRAANDILGYTLRIRELQEFESRLEACEHAISTNRTEGGADGR